MSGDAESPGSGDAGPARRWVISSDGPCFIGPAEGRDEIVVSEAASPHGEVAVRWTGRSVEIRAIGPDVRPVVEGRPVLHARVQVGGQFGVRGTVFEVSGPATISRVPPTVESTAPVVGTAAGAQADPGATNALDRGDLGGAWSVPERGSLAIGSPSNDGNLVVAKDVPVGPTVKVSWTGSALEVRASASSGLPLSVDGRAVVHARLAVGEQFTVRDHVFAVCGPAQFALMDKLAPAPGSGRPSDPGLKPSPPTRQQSTDGPSRWAVPHGVTLTIGRVGGPADIALAGLDLTQRHATVSWTGSAVELRSTAAEARPFVNGQPVLHARLRVGGRFMIGNHTLAVSAPAEITLLESQVIAKEPLLRFAEVSLQYRGRPEPTLKELSFELSRGEVLAIIGPSGAGKSTMCSGLLGEVSVASGSMMLGQVNLASSRMQASHLVSFVPQQPAMVENLTVRDSLNWVARLRLASDANPSARARRVESVVGAMELTNDVDKRVSELSGGQRKRVSTAMELLSDPLLLVLDEPTSGLDEGLDRTMMQSLRRAAEQGCAVIVVTHSMVNIDQADKVLALTHRGRLAFIGAATQLLAAFDANSYADVMDKLRRDTVTKFRTPVAPHSLGPAEPVTASEPTRGSLTRHLPSLIGREVARQRNSVRQLAASLGSGVLLTALLASAASKSGLSGDSRQISAMLIAFIVCLTFFSMAQSFSAVVDDRDVIQRESRWSISAASMILARALTCAPLAVALGLASVGLYVLIKPRGPYDPVLPHPAGLVLFAVLLPLAAMAVGLLISTVSTSLRQAVFVLMAVLALQVVMTGLAPPFQGNPGKVLEALANFTPSRWASGGLGADAGITSPRRAGELPPDAVSPSVLPDQLVPSPFQGSIWTHDMAHVLTAASALVAMTAVALGATVLILRRQLLATR